MVEKMQDAEKAVDSDSGAHHEKVGGMAGEILDQVQRMRLIGLIAQQSRRTRDVEGVAEPNRGADQPG